MDRTSGFYPEDFGSNPNGCSKFFIRLLKVHLRMNLAKHQQESAGLVFESAETFLNVFHFPIPLAGFWAELLSRGRTLNFCGLLVHGITTARYERAENG